MSKINLKEIFAFIPYDNKKYAILSPIMGAFAIFICLVIYGSVSLFLEGKNLSFADGVVMILYTTPTFFSISLVFSYVLSLMTFLPTYKKRQENLWSNGKFWFINSFIGTVIGILVVVASIWKMGFLFGFMMFTACFFASMFTSFMYTTLITVAYNNMNEKEKAK